MKKNLRIVSAAAAALLAVAPVAATVVPAASTTVSAASSVIDASKNGLFTKNIDLANNGELGKTTITNFIRKQLNDNTVSADTVTITNGGKTATFTIKGTPNADAPAAVREAGYNAKLDAQGFVTVGSGHSVKPANFTVNAKFAAAIEKGYFAYRNNDGQLVWVSGPEATNSSVYANVDALNMNNRMFEKVNEDTDSIKISHAWDVVEELLSAGETATYRKNGNSAIIDWKQVKKDSKDFASQLRSQGITVSADGKTFVPGNKMFHFNILANNGDTVTVYFQNDNARNTTDPVLLYRTSTIRQVNGNTIVDYSNWERLVNRAGNVHAVMVQQSDNGTFQPSQYFAAWNNENQKALIGNVEFSDSNVNLQVPGLYHITVKATNAANKTATATEVPVIVYARDGKQMTVIANGDVYTESNGAMVKANNLNYEHVVNPGNQLRVYDKKTVNGTDYYRIISPNTNAWVKASDLKDGVVTPATQETTKTVTIMHISAIYDKNGVATHDPALRAYDTYSVVSEPVTINGAKFYKLAGKDQYIKVGNVDGTSRALKHNSYVYKSTGKRANKKTLKKGSSVTTYGKSFMIAGHQMYRIGKNQYVKKANF